MLELKALLLTQGMHGMVSQVEGLAKALGLSYKHQKIELKSFWNLKPLDSVFCWKRILLMYRCQAILD